MIKKVGIVSTGSYVPEKVLTNFDLEKMVETNDEWIRSRTGIVQRRISANGSPTSDLATRAAQRALEQAQINPEELDLIITATVSPDHFFPSTACQVQYKLGAKRAAAFDLSAACTGFLYSMSAAWKFIATGMYQTILIIGAETLSAFVDYQDRNTCILFGDGAGAAILKETTTGQHEILYTSLGADGSGGDTMILPAGGSKLPASHQTIDERLHCIRIKGKEVFNHETMDNQKI